MAETASCAGARRRSSVERMSTAALERPSPTGTATRHVVSARLARAPARRAAVRSGAVRRSRRRVPVAAPGVQRAATTLARRRALGFDARASATAWLIGAGLESLDPSGGGGDRGLERLSRSRPAPRRRRRLRRSPRPRRGRPGGAGGAARVAAAHGPRAGGLRGRAVRGRTRPCDRAARSATDDLGPRRGGRRRAAVPALQRASSPSGSPRSSAMPTGGSAPSTSTRLRRAVARIAAQLPTAALPVASATVACGLRARRRRRRPRAGRSSPASSPATPRAPSSERTPGNPGVDGGQLLLL